MLTAAYYKAMRLYDNAGENIAKFSIELALTAPKEIRKRLTLKSTIKRWEKKRDLYHLQWFLLAEEERKAI